MLKQKLAILISGEGTNLQAIIDAIAANKLDATIAVVISNKANANGLNRAKLAGIKTEVISKSKQESSLDYDIKLLKNIQKYQPDWIILAGFMRILKAPIIDAYPHHILNIHPALLPKYPGLDTHAKVLENKDTEHGSTVHIVTKDLDAGPILAKAKLKVLVNESVQALKARVQQLEHQLYPLVIQWLIQDRFNIRNGTILFDHEILSAKGLLIDLQNPHSDTIIN